MSAELVLLLGDDSKAMSDLVAFFDHLIVARDLLPFIGPTLTSTRLPSYEELAQFRVVMLIAGNHYPKFSERFQADLVRYVRQGGTALATPFIAWSVSHMGNRLIDEIIPVTSEAFGEEVDCEWCIAADKAGNATDFDRFQIVQTLEEAKAKDGTLVILHEGETSIPLLTLARYELGAVIYLNASHHVCGKGDLPIFRCDGIRSALKASLEALLNGPFEKRDLERPILNFSLNSFGPTGRDYPRKLPVNPEPTDVLSQYLEALHFESALAVHREIHSPQGGVLTPKCEPPGAKKRTVLPDIGHFLSLPQLAQLGVLRLALAHHPHWPMTNEEKGRFLEQWSALFFSAIEGISVIDIRRRGRSAEVDLILRNESRHPFWVSLGSPLLVECKNVSEKVGASVARDFIGKIEDLGIHTGFLISPLGVSGSPARDAEHVIRSARVKDVKVLSLSFDQLRTILLMTDLTTGISNEYYHTFGKL